MVYYLKYRPQTIAELDSEKLRETLTAVLSQKEIPHAFLFTGPKGLGKTSTARIVAKSVNCLERKGKSIEPCNHCEQCVSITQGTNIDVLEIDGASNRGIDEIRDLREKIHLAPSSAKKKVYIIDEVHMLTTEAFNALLKTVEEPPAHALFIFCTTEPHKVPATILSRCFHISFVPATRAELIRSFTRIVAGEKIVITDDALELLAHLADRGFRDGTKILEEMVALAKGKEITKEFIASHYSVSNIQQLGGQFISLLTQGKTKEALALIQTIREKGIDVRYFTGQLLDLLHMALLEGVGVGEKGERVQKLSLEQISLLAQVLSNVYQEQKVSPLPQLPLELAVIAYSSREERSDESRSPEENSSRPHMSKASHTMDTLLKKQHAMRVKTLLGKEEKKEKGVASAPSHTQHDIHGTADEHTKLLENLIYKVKPYNHSVAGVLRGCKVISCSDAEIVFQAGYVFHKERLEERDTQDILVKALKELTGKQLQIVVELKK